MVAPLLCCLFFLVAALSLAQRSFYAGAMGGIATLSGDARSEVTAASARVSQYKPENGAALDVFAGIHLTDFVSVQADYITNRNRLTLVSSAGDVFYEQARRSTQHAVHGDCLLYFRNRRSWVRPYLSAGVGVSRFTSSAGDVRASRGSPVFPPAEFTSIAPVLRVAVGIDLRIHSGWALRYSFSEAIRGNPISNQLSPRGERGLANFQNLFGLSYRF